MNFIDQSYFIIDNLIAQRGQVEVQEAIGLYISRYQDKFLVELLGISLFQALKSGMQTSPIDPRWTDLLNGKIYTDTSGNEIVYEGIANNTTKVSPVANYVYYWYMRSIATFSTGSGQVAPKVANGLRADAGDKMVLSWRNMIDLNYSCIHFLQSNRDIYPEWDGYKWGEDEWQYFFASWPDVRVTRVFTYWWPNKHHRPDIFTPINTFNI